MLAKGVLCSEVVSVLPLKQELLCPAGPVFVNRFTPELRGATGFYLGPRPLYNIFDDFGIHFIHLFIYF